MIKLCFLLELCLQESNPLIPILNNSAVEALSRRSYILKRSLGIVENIENIVDNMLYRGKSGGKETEYNFLIRVKKREIKDNRFWLRELKSLVQAQRK